MKGSSLGLYSRICGQDGRGKSRSVEKSKGGTFPLRLEILEKRPDFHFSHRPGHDRIFPISPRHNE